MTTSPPARTTARNGKTYPANYAANRAAIRAALEADPNATTTAIAKRLGTTRDTVADVRRSLKGAIVQTETDQTRIDVFSLPVHPWAAMFPMRSDDDLEAMAQSIKANGLRIPVVIGMAVVEDGGEPTLCVIDGRNRIAACRIAGVTPRTVTLNGDDQDAFIADANLERRDLTKGQKAMLLAVRYPEPGKRGRGNKSFVANDISTSRIRYARAVVAMCPDLVPQIIAGAIGLDEAYAVAQQRRVAKQSSEARYDVLRKTDPDLADQVNEEKLTLNEAEAAARARREDEESTLRSHVQTVKDISRYIATYGAPAIDELARAYASNPERFHTGDLLAELDMWIAKASAIREKINAQTRH